MLQKKPSSSAQILEIQDLFLRYPSRDQWILNGVDLKLSAGETLALVGQSGSGKSSLARVILQSLPLGSLCHGKVTLLGQDPRILSKYRLRRLRGEAVGLVFQDPMTRLNPLMTVGGHLIDNLQAHLPRETYRNILLKAYQLLEKVDLDINRFNSYPHELSGGMRQRLSIALAISLNPPLLIADEPTTSLDVAVASQIMSEINQLCKQMGTTLLLITHDLALASKWCDRIAILDQGKIVEDNSFKDFLSRPNSSIGANLIKAISSRESSRTSSDIGPQLVLEVNQLRCWHPLGRLPWQKSWLRAVDEVSFSLKAGETIGIVGVSGCGKSTLCRALMGLNPIKGGEIKMLGQTITDKRGKISNFSKKSMQMIFQDPFASINPKMVIMESIIDPLLINKISSRKDATNKAKNLLNKVGLEPLDFQDRYPSQLSGGQLQRVAIARALVLEPSVLICDESISMLDVEIQSEILDLLNALQKQMNFGILFITHDLIVAKAFCNKIIILDDGKIIEEGSGESIINSPNSALTKKLIQSCPRL